MLRLIIYMSIFFAIVVAIKVLPIELKYKKSQYGEASGNGVLNLISNTGNYGEFLTFPINN